MRKTCQLWKRATSQRDTPNTPIPL
jgi:hypothetical protein